MIQLKKNESKIPTIQGGNKKSYGDQVSVVCSHGESGSVFVSQWDVDLQGVGLFKLTSLETV